GGMGEVWQATDELLDRSVAVKLLKPEYADDPGFRSRFRAEARLAAGLSHPGVAGVFDYGEDTETTPAAAFLVMELVAGEPLSARLARDGRLPVVEALDVVAQAALALDAAHAAGIVHRDVKPGNLLLRPDGVVKVTDFGIARAAGTSTLTDVGVVMGTAHYLSPEQSSGARATPASDVYALGVVAYECLAGYRPFEGDTPVAVAVAHQRDQPPALPPDVPALVGSLVLQTLAKSPADRPPSAASLGRTAAALRDALAADTVAVPGVAAAPTPTRPLTMPVLAAGEAVRGRQRRRVRAPAIGLALLGLLLVAALLHPHHGPARVPVPALAGDSLASARGALLAHHLQVATLGESSTSVAAGSVIGSRPGPGASVPAGSTVTLLVSSGPSTVNVSASRYLGQPVSTVQPELTALGLQVTVVSAPGSAPGPAGSTAPAGTVTSVYPTGTVDVGATVTVVVATGPTNPPGPPGHGKGQGDQGGH
ncbi:MAG: protein kinase domain-containing protein, partial [Mycobacteriales bacterium]